MKSWEITGFAPAGCGPMYGGLGERDGARFWNALGVDIDGARMVGGHERRTGWRKQLPISNIEKL